MSSKPAKIPACYLYSLEKYATEAVNTLNLNIGFCINFFINSNGIALTWQLLVAIAVEYDLAFIDSIFAGDKSPPIPRTMFSFLTVSITPPEMITYIYLIYSPVSYNLTPLSKFLI